MRAEEVELVEAIRAAWKEVHRVRNLCNAAREEHQKLEGELSAAYLTVSRREDALSHLLRAEAASLPAPSEVAAPPGES